MVKFKMIIFFLVGASLIYSCTSNSTSDKNSSSKETEATDKTSRPEKSDENASSVIWKYDSKVADIMRSVKELKKSVKDGGKVTETIEVNITEMFQEAKTLQDELKPLLDKLSQDDFDLYERDKDRLRDEETTFEQLKQNK